MSRQKTNAELTMSFTKKPHESAPEKQTRPGEAIKWSDTPGEIIRKLQREGYDTSSLRVRPLTFDEVTSWGEESPERIWHLAANAENVQAAIDKHEANENELRPIREKNRQTTARDFVTEVREWKRTGNKSITWEHDADWDKMVTASQAAFKKYAQFACAGNKECVTHNYDACFSYIDDAGLDARQSASWQTALLELAKRGKIIAANSDGQLISGDALQNSPELPNLLTPALTVRQKREAADRKFLHNLSAEEFLNSYADPADRQAILDGAYVDGGAEKNRQIAAQEAGSYKRAVDSFKHLNPTYYSTSDNQDKLIAWLGERSLPMTVSNLSAAFKDLVGRNQMTLVNSAVRYGGTTVQGEGHAVSHGQATAAESLAKPSLRAYVRNHSAAEIAERCRVEPSFRKALDGGLD